MDSTFRKLQSLLNGCYSFTTTNAERALIEKQLQEFIFQNDSWKICLNIIKLGQDNIVDMFCLSSLETIVKSAWQNISFDDKNLFKSSIFEFMFDPNLTFNNQKLKKICHVFILIGKKDFPINFPEFFNIVLKALNDEEKHQIGIELLDQILDEFFSTNSTAFSTIKKLLKSSILDNYQSTLKILHYYLFDIYKKCFSPNNLQRSNSFGSATELTTPTSQNFLVLNNIQRSKSPAPEFMNSGSSNNSTLKSTSMDDSSNIYMGNLIMEVIIKYLKFLPSDAFLNNQLISTLIQFASIPFTFTSVKNDKVKLSALSVAAITEIVSQLGNYSCADTFFSQIVDWSFQFLVNGITVTNSYSEYLRNIVDFFKAFFPIFHRKYCYNSCQNSLKYLTEYMKFALTQNDCENINICIQTITRVNVEINENFIPVSGAEIDIFRNEMYNLMSEFSLNLVKRSLYKYKGEYPEFVEHDEEKEKEYKSEIANLLIELPTKSEYYIYAIFEILFGDIIKLFRSLLSISSTNSISVCFSNISPQDQKSIIYAMKDASVIAYYLSFILNRSVITNYTSDFQQFIKELYQAFEVIELLCCNVNQNFEGNSNFSIVESDLLKESLNIVSINIIWSAQIQGEIKENLSLASNIIFDTTMDQLLLANTSKTLNSIFQIINSHSKDKCSILAATFFLRLVKSCSVPMLFQAWDVFGFLDHLKSGAFLGVRKNAISLLYEAGCHLILNKSSHQILKINESNLYSIIGNLFQNLFFMFSNLSSALPAQFYKKTINSDDVIKYKILSRIFKDVINSFNFLQSSKKRPLFEIFKECICQSIQNISSLHDMLGSTLEINIAAISSFHGLLKEDYHQQLLMALLNSSIKPNLTTANNIDLLEKSQLKVIEVIDVILDANISASEFFASNNILMNYLYPLIKDKKSSNVHFEFCKLLNSILFSKCEYFYKQQNPEIQSILRKYLEVLLNEFSSENIQLVKDFLSSLLGLDDRYNLFSKPPFNDKQFIGSLCFALFKMLCDSSFLTVREEILNNLFSIAKNDLGEFYRDLVPYFLSNIPSLSNENRQEIFNQVNMVQDQPTFNTVFIELANNINAFSLANQKPNIMSFS